MEKLKVKAIIEKIKSINHIEIIIGIIAVIIMALIYIGINTRDDGNQKTTVNEPVSTLAQGDEWEKKLEAVLSEIDGVGNAKVMITYESTTEKITANTTTTSSNSSSSTSGNENSSQSITESPIIIMNNGNNEPYITKEIMPKIIGVIVVAEGAESPIIKLSILRAVQTVLSVNAASIEIFSMK